MNQFEEKCKCGREAWPGLDQCIACLAKPECQTCAERDELLRECSEVIRELYNEMADWVGMDFRGETPHTKPMSKAAALLAKLEGKR